MNLIKERFLEISKTQEDNYHFPVIDKDTHSYYIKYEESKHASDAVVVYDSSDIVAIRNNFSTVWSDEKELEVYLPIILNGIRKSSESADGQYRNIELYNYMM